MDIEQVPGADPTGSDHATVKNIRGSVLLSAGHFVAVGVNFGAHILVVRHLAQSDYGALAYATSMVSIGSSIAVFGMNKTLARFLPTYEEQGDYDRLFGALALGLGIMLGLALSLVLLFYALRGAAVEFLIDSETTLAVLMILILLVPIQTLGSALLGLMAIFGSPRLIFMRRHVLAPLLYLAVVILLITGERDVFFLAAGSVIAAALGSVVFAFNLIRVLRRRGLFDHFDPRTLRVPFRELLGFSLPLLSVDLVFVLRGALIVVILGAMTGTAEIALFGAVAPIAKQNMLVMESFRLLFMPAAARLLARGDGRGIDDLYWQTTVWVAVFTLPILLLSLSLAQPLTIFLFGSEYADAAGILAVLAVGYYVNAAFGFNGLTLRAFGRVRYLVTVDVLIALVGLSVSVLLIRLFGAIGAAMGVSMILVAQNILYQLGLGGGTSVSPFARRYLRVYLGIPLAAAFLLAVQWLVQPPLYAGVGLAALVWLAFFAANRSLLRIAEMFPELKRMPMAGLFLR